MKVVYGDTDSVFVNSNVTNFEDALRISATFKKAVNEQYRLLEIDLDGVFQRLLLLQKKKYAAVKIEDGLGTKTSIEVKGLDMKRREYCALSKQVSQYVQSRHFIYLYFDIPQIYSRPDFVWGTYRNRGAEYPRIFDDCR
jgi:DNA polymerase alpha subunit A